MKKVEYLRAWDDNTWDTEIYDIPNDKDPQDMSREILERPENKNCILIAVYNENPEGEDN